MMTLTRGPCDLDTMSLFQDLKLKRRKVDSRCSSDGESVADTSTSSPDVGPPSPTKMDPSPSPQANREASPDSVGGTPDQHWHSKTPSPKPSVIVPPSTNIPSIYLLQPKAASPDSALGCGPEEVGERRRVKEELVHSVFDGGGWRGQETLRAEATAGRGTTPSVVLGEAGGVRTMVWSAPEPPPPQPGPNWPGQPDLEETAAHLLLTLGQDTPGRGQLNMERLWAGDLSQLPPAQQVAALNLSYAWPPKPDPRKALPPEPEHDDDEQPMICMICEDKATGLHYGIITCEGCKGFFKRTVQNRRVYTCVANGTCEITKAQRNRCQYCRFKKCIEQGMVLQAVREDRMPGGRNSGAVYNLYKVKYKKHKKSIRNGQVKPNQEVKGKPVGHEPAGIPPHLINGTILKTALTNPSEVVHLRQRLDNTVSSSRDRTPLTLDTTVSMIQALIDCDEFQDIATLKNLDDLLDNKSDLSDKLMQIGDSIVYKLVQWTKRLPFYLELPVEVHTRLLTHKWHELLVLTTSAYQAIHGHNKLASISSDGTEAHFTQEVSNNLCTLQTCLTSMMGRPITMDQLRQDVGLMVEKITYVTLMFRRMKLTMQEYVCLKVIIMLNPVRSGSTELDVIQERYMTCLRNYVEFTSPNQPNRFHDLLLRLPEVQSAASLLLESKMFYVPFLLNSAIQR